MKIGNESCSIEKLAKTIVISYWLPSFRLFCAISKLIVLPFDYFPDDKKKQSYDEKPKGYHGYYRNALGVYKRLDKYDQNDVSYRSSYIREKVNIFSCFRQNWILFFDMVINLSFSFFELFSTHLWGVRYFIFVTPEPYQIITSYPRPFLSICWIVPGIPLRKDQLSSKMLGFMFIFAKHGRI